MTIIGPDGRPTFEVREGRDWVVVGGYRYRGCHPGEPLGKLRYDPPYLTDATAAAQLLLLFTHHPDFLEP